MSETWAVDLTRRIAGQIRELRGDRSGQWLSDRTADLGHRVSRSTISELENGKRNTIAVDAVIVLAAALEVSVFELMYPGSGDIEYLPGKTMSRSEVAVALISETGVRETRQHLMAEVEQSLDLLAKYSNEIRAIGQDARESLAKAEQTRAESKQIRDEAMRLIDAAEADLDADGR